MWDAVSLPGWPTWERALISDPAPDSWEGKPCLSYKAVQDHRICSGPPGVAESTWPLLGLRWSPHLVSENSPPISLHREDAWARNLAPPSPAPFLKEKLRLRKGKRLV